MNFNVAWLTTNRTCNNSCKWCYAKNTLKNSKNMDFETAKIAIDQLERRKVKKIILIGGEPTIYPNFIELVDYINKKKLQVSLATNGRKFKDMDFCRRVVNAGITNIDISLKGITEDEYFQNTGAKGLKEMLKGYSNLKKLNCNVSVSYVVVDDNKEKFDRLIDFLSENNITNFGVQFVKPVIEEQNQCYLSLEKMGTFTEYIYKKLEELNIQYSIEISFPLCLIKENILNELIEKRRISSCCHVPSGTGIIFDQEFRILPCNHFAEYPFIEESIDFSNSESIEELWSSHQVEEFRKVVRCYPTFKCSMCNLWNICGGGCITRWLYLDPNDYIK